MGKQKSENTITKTVWQHSAELPDETMEFLRGIAEDYAKVKQHIYKRYSGIKSMNKLTPVYTIQNEMRYCGLRDQLNLPVVYYELAIGDAVADIKSNWGMLKNKLNELITANENLSDNDKKYLRTVLKINSIYGAVLNDQEYRMPDNTADLPLDVKRLNHLLKRLTRRHLQAPHVNSTNTFRITPAGYSYKDDIFRIVCRVPRKRILIPLKDGRKFNRQILIYVKENDIALAVPAEKEIVKHDDYTNIVYIHIGNKDMFTLSNGIVYGAALDRIVDPETKRLNEKIMERNKARKMLEQSLETGNLSKAANIKANNLGIKKYEQHKEKERSKTNTFINAEINRMIEQEKPGKIVITRAVTKNRSRYPSKAVNRKLTRSFGGYVRERLKYKCCIHSIELIEINSNGTGSTCSVCGEQGKRLPGQEFHCEHCKAKSTISLNCARNIEKKYKKVGMQGTEDK